MLELVKKSAADFIRLSVREVSSAFRDGLIKMSIGARSSAAAATDDSCSTSPALGVIHSLRVKPSVMTLLCLLAIVLKALTFSSIEALTIYPV